MAGRLAATAPNLGIPTGIGLNARPGQVTVSAVPCTVKIDRAKWWTTSRLCSYSVATTLTRPHRPHTYIHTSRSSGTASVSREYGPTSPSEALERGLYECNHDA